MCGIGGTLGSPAPDEAALLGALAHRGPDHQAVARLAAAGGVPVTLCFTRLSILDLSPLGHQPMATEDGALTLVYNGEAYNCRALRRRLEGLGHRFRSTADTEVVLRGYRAWGPEVLSRLRGMFALALWDAGAQELFLARDRIGKKPLYYGYDGQRFFFASELRALLAAGLCGRRLDPRGLHGYLALGSVPQPHTLLRGVQMLLPGQALRVRVAGGRVLAPEARTYFHLPAPGGRFVEEDASGGAPLQPGAPDPAQAVAGVLQEAVAQRLLADVPVGLLLSGGVDSTAVALLARRADPAGALHSFTLTYGAAQAESEGAEAQLQARLLHLIHHEAVESAASLLAQVPAYMDAVDQPSVDGFNTYLVSRAVRRAGLKVALSGLGGDEIFLGYGLRRPFVAALRLAPLLALGPRLSAGASLRRGKQAALLQAAARPADESQRARALYAALRALWPAAQLEDLLEADVPTARLDPAEHVRCELSPMQRAAAPADALLAYLEVQNYLCNTLLRDADVMSMVHGVELRVPLCDHRLVSLLLALPGGARRDRPGLRGRGRQKPLLLDACRSPVLDRVAARPKRGFVLPLREWLKGPELGAEVAPVLHEGALLRAAGLRPERVAAWWRDYQAGRAPEAVWRLWSLYTLLRWLSLHRVGL